MQIVSHSRKLSSRAHPQKCAFCRDPMPSGDPAQSSDVCRLCASEIEAFGWRTVYDRDSNLGQIPSNLRSAYKL